MKKTFKKAAVAMAIGVMVSAAHAGITTDNGVNADNNEGFTLINSLNGFDTSINSGRDLNLTSRAGNSVYIKSDVNADNATAAYIQLGGDNTKINAVGTNTINANTNNVTASGTNSANNISGTTNINTAGGANTTIGNNAVANVTSINSTTNNIGAGYASTNNIGTGTSASTTNIGNGNAAVNVSGNTSINTGAANTNTTSINTAGTGNVTIGNVGNTTSLNSSTNNIGVNAFATTNNMGTGTAASSNNIGTGSAVTTNRIGNTNSGTTVTATAGNASQSLANNSANTLVTGGTSGLTARTGVANVNTSAQVLLQNSGGTAVDANGKIITAGSTGYVAPTAPTAALTLTNGYGNTHGLVVTESQATLSGGTQSSSLTLNDTNARFSRASDGAPITVTGVADGRNDFDAINVRQFANAIAGVTALTNIPGLQQGQEKSIGVGVGSFMGKSALALGLNYRVDAKTALRVSASTGLGGGAKPVIGAGAAWAF
jgi:hypothetical protein